MSVVYEPPKRDYVNVMEILVAEEVERQLRRLAPRVAKYVKRLEVETYALNRLPPLYASSEKGWEHQYEKARHSQRTQITKAVMQAMAAVQVDPIRSSRPLAIHKDESQSALKILRDLLQQPDLTWEGIINRIRPMLGATAPPPSDPTASNQPKEDEHRHYWRPGTYGAEVSWKHKHPKPEEGFDWSDNRYSK